MIDCLYWKQNTILINSKEALQIAGLFYSRATIIYLVYSVKSYCQYEKNLPNTDLNHYVKFAYLEISIYFNKLLCYNHSLTTKEISLRKVKGKIVKDYVDSLGENGIEKMIMKTKLSRSIIFQLINGTCNNPTLKVIDKICKVTGVKFEKLFPRVK